MRDPFGFLGPHGFRFRRSDLSNYPISLLQDFCWTQSVEILALRIQSEGAILSDECLASFLITAGNRHEGQGTLKGVGEGVSRGNSSDFAGPMWASAGYVYPARTSRDYSAELRLRS